ncbi:hypothetical protein [Alishewanella sp. SMS8]|uniref:hypothetical protein n=1 Tax=Alishewanella sp. SMS8 TaxID=2994676 RepID=UPI00274168AA|nr:hypothetical protein [Alishewanella sp. SMS8]MDP5459870.1 hypothetical protein [Alishewanella sp. SMS8]
MAAIPKLVFEKALLELTPNNMRYVLWCGGFGYLPWWAADHLNINHADGNRINGAELRAATMLEF